MNMKIDSLFTSGDRAEDVIEWAKKIFSLGRLITTVGENEPEALGWLGPQIGSVITDYAEAIEAVVTDAYISIRDHFGEHGDSPAGIINRKYERLSGITENGIKESMMKDILKEIDPIIDESKALYEIRHNLRLRLGLENDDKVIRFQDNS